MLALAAIVATAAEPCARDGAFVDWGDGIAFGVFAAKTPVAMGDGKIRIVRLDPERWRLAVDEQGHDPVDERAAALEGSVVIANAGMFDLDHRTHVGSLTVGGEEHGKPNRKYESLAVFEPGFAIVDLDTPHDLDALRKKHRYTVQNLRLIKHPAENRWPDKPKARRWSELALATDADGHVWFAFTRSPFRMHDLNDELIRLGAVAAQHLEGGPEASLLARTERCGFRKMGSFETDFLEQDDNDRFWALPNVIVARPRVP